VGVSALTVYDSKLIAGGYFTTAGGDSANYIASWDGSSWSALGSGVGDYSRVYALTVYDNKLIAGGYITTAGGISANDIASWDGTSWSALGSGMSGSVSALTVYDSRLTAGGGFTIAGGKVSAYLAQWTKGMPFICGDVNGDSEVTWGDLASLREFYFNYGDWPTPPQAGDLNLDGLIDMADLIWLAEYLNGYATPPCYGGTGHRDVKKAARDATYN